MDRRIDLETLRLLVGAAESGSLSSAAGVLGISQPAASARIREFETRWQLNVLRRSSRGSRLTSDGEVVVAWARAVLHSADTMHASLEALTASRHEGVVVAASLTIAEQLLPRWLEDLHARFPDAQPILSVVNSERVASAVRSGTASVGFIETAVMPADLARKRIGQDRLAVVVTPGHRWAQRTTPLPVEELFEERWVLRESGSGTRRTFESALRREPQIALEGASTAAVISAALAGFGPAVVSYRSVAAELKAARLVSVPLALDLVRPLTAVWRKDEKLRGRAADLLSIAIEDGLQSH